jgi:hypothetical protein
MNESLERSFGLVIAYVLPGFACLWGASNLSPLFSHWLAIEPQADPTIASFLYTLLASLAAGLTVSAVRWAAIDALHHRTGVPYPDPDFSKLQEHLEGFKLSIELYYRYYQFYANMFVAIVFAVACRILANGALRITTALAIAVLEGVLLIASRDSLGRYYTRIGQLLGVRRHQSSDDDFD